MRKLLGGLGLCLALGFVKPALAQDPFGVPNEGLVPIHTGPSFSEFPAEPQAPIIQTAPMAKAERPYNETPLKSRTQNAYVRTNRTQAQEYIQQRAQIEAQQRIARIEYRKWRGESLLRPDNRADDFWWSEYDTPVWLLSHHR